MHDLSSEPVLPLARYRLAVTGSPEEIRSMVGREINDYGLSLVGRDEQLRARFHGVSLRNAGLYYLAYGATVRLDILDAGGFVVQMPLAGSAAISMTGAERFVSHSLRPAVLQPRTRAGISLDAACEHLLIRLDEDLVRSVLRKKLCRDVNGPLAFAPQMDLTIGANRAFRELLTLLTSMLDNDVSHSSLAISEFETLLAGQLLIGQPNRYSEELHRPARPAVARTISRAADLIEAHADQHLTGDDIAAAVGISTRSLQDGFRRYFGVTPRTYIRNVRLQRARHELLCADPARVTVTSVAVRWGFSHLGRFSALYRTAFGESPSDTLRLKDDAPTHIECG
ncbi:AraC-like ligand-binding domain-containing protein [Nocardia sp. R6R-6]|uniref:AraC-like ligand-binding domain-containing protein n=1 Tax=Nocardia sp. R6R-6 TaxID=3459303 RepID=UPI00403DED9F